MSTYIDPLTLPPIPLPPTITSRYIDCTPNSLIFHVLESKPPSDTPDPPRILLIHGFPELAFSWRHMLPLLSSAPHNFHALAFDQRGYGRTHPPRTDSPLPSSTFTPLTLLRDTLHLLSALGWSSVDVVVGHDFGAVTAALCALARPDIFKSVILMSHPTKGVPNRILPHRTAADQPSSPDASGGGGTPWTEKPDINASLAQLARPRKHYKWYYCTSPANQEMTYPTGPPLHDFLRGYFHLKSADWAGNSSPAPHRLPSWTADALSVMPRYYIMDAPGSMRDNVASDMSQPSTQSEIQSRPFEPWLPDPDLAVYVAEYTRTTFAAPLTWYAIQTQPALQSETLVYAGLKIAVPCAFVVGEADWGHFQEPGAVEAMEGGQSVERGAWRGTRVVKGAGHWVSQERPGECVGVVGEMVGEVRRGGTR